MTAAAPTARLKTRYLEEIRPALLSRFGYSSIMQAPRLEKITVNMGVGLAKQDSKVLKAALDQLATIAGQQPSVRRARKSIASFKLREGMPVGVAVTLRSERGYEFLDRLVSIAIPRIRDFRGLNPRSFDGRGNYSLGVREQIIFPEIDYDAIDQVRGLDITITTTAATDVEAFALLSAMGMPFAAQGRPAGFDLPGEETAKDAVEQPETAALTEPEDSVESETAAPAEAKDAVEQPETAALTEPEDSVESETAAPAEAEDAVQQPETAASAEPEDSVASETAAPGETEDAVEPPKAKAARSAKSKRRTKRPAAEASSEEDNRPPDSADADTAEKESAD
jgi:large subunit ribosomal protein L5